MVREFGDRDIRKGGKRCGSGFSPGVLSGLRIEADTRVGILLVRSTDVLH
jgi:hypothetical protein